MGIIRYLTLFLLFSSSIPLLEADTLLIDSVASGKTISKPVTGMSMHKVQNRFGEPSARIPAIGLPPISRWSYDNFIVYFEHQHVVHTVIPR